MWRGINSKKGKLLIASAVLVFTFGSVSYGGHSYREWTKWTEDSVLAMAWSGFGPEKGLYNFTVVTALVDIGRGSWGSQSRSYNTYLLYMQRVLRLDVNMVIFVDQQGKPFIDWMRRGRENRTHIILTRFKDVPYYSLRERIAEIMESAEYRQDNQLVDKHLCESYIPEYDILQLSKLYFMDRVARENPFDNSYFMWIDGGYGHGQDVHPVDGVWIPRGLFEYPNQITFLERTPGVNVFASKKSKLHKLSINIVAGNFFAGGGEVFKTVYELQKKEVDEWMERGIIDDDQTMYMYLYYRRPDLFHLVPGDWNDVFKFFNSAQR